MCAAGMAACVRRVGDVRWNGSWPSSTAGLAPHGDMRRSAAASDAAGSDASADRPARCLPVLPDVGRGVAHTPVHNLPALPAKSRRHHLLRALAATLAAPAPAHVAVAALVELPEYGEAPLPGGNEPATQQLRNGRLSGAGAQELRPPPRLSKEGKRGGHDATVSGRGAVAAAAVAASNGRHTSTGTHQEAHLKRHTSWGTPQVAHIKRHARCFQRHFLSLKDFQRGGLSQKLNAIAPVRSRRACVPLIGW